MSTLPLGSAFKRQQNDYGPLAEMVASLRDSVIADVRADIQNSQAALVQALAKAVTDAINRIPAPQVSVAAPQVSVAAPEVSVTPTITLEGEDDAGEILAMEQQTSVLRSILSELVNLRTLLGQPVHRHVERGSNGEITGLTESRG